ncbi:MAG: FAD-dependent oxidoreductase [Anaerolineae bacterium]|nr:FAD-dependent oxidoreductase [Anaerolineae bacterium]
MPVEFDDDVFPAVIVGAGLAGLSAAVHLAARDIPPLVLEADTEWAGGCLSGGPPDTFEFGDRTWSFRSEHGAHALWGGYDNMRAMLDHFLDIELRASEGEEWINRWKNRVRWHEAGTAVRRTWLVAPFHYLQLLLKPRFWNTITPLDFLSLPGFLISLLLTVGFDPIEEGIELEGLLMKDYFRLWTPNLRATFIGLGHSLLAAPSEKISLSAFIAAIRYYTLLRRDTWQLEYLPANAHDCLIQPMIDFIEGKGGKVILGARAVSLQREETHWQVRVDDARRGGIRSLEAAHVILAVEPPAAQRVLMDSPGTADAAASITFPPALRNATARLWFDTVPRDGAPGGMFTGEFAIDNFFWLHRLHEEFFEWHRVTGGSAIEVHFYATDDVLDQSDQVLLIMAVDEVQRAFPRLRGHFVHGAIRRNGKTQTQFLVPTKDSLFVETPWPQLYACGDWIGHPSPSLWMERSCITGMEAANHVLRAYQAQPFAIIPPREPEPLAQNMGRIVKIGRRIVGPPIRFIARTLRRI